MDEPPKKICHEQRQAFIDCMYIHSRCVQSGAKSFKECLQEEQDKSALHPDCQRLLRDYHVCHAQIVPTQFCPWL